VLVGLQRGRGLHHGGQRHGPRRLAAWRQHLETTLLGLSAGVDLVF
jgi:hypothetical protein